MIPGISRGGTNFSGLGLEFSHDLDKADDLNQNQQIYSDLVNKIKRSFLEFINIYEVQDNERLEILEKAESEIYGSRIGGYYLRHLECLAKNSPKLDMKVINLSVRSRVAYLYISMEDLENFENSFLFDLVIQFTPETILIFDEILVDFMEKKIDEWYSFSNDQQAELKFSSVRVSFCNYQKILPLRNFGSDEIETLVATRGICIRTSGIIPEMQSAVFRCTGKISKNFKYTVCNNELSSAVYKGFIDEPQFCEKCQSTRSFVLEHSKCVFSSKQLIKIQESPESIPEGETPQTLFGFLYDSLVNSIIPGDQIVVTGIYRALSIRRSNRTKLIKSVFRTGIDILHVENQRKTQFTTCIDQEDLFELVCNETDCDQTTVEDSDIIQNLVEVSKKFSPSFMAKARAFSQEPNVYEKLVSIFAPNIWENTDVKKGLLCQLFGGVPETIRDGTNRIRSRGEIHVLLCGDPSTSKSQLLQYVNKIAPKSVYSVGKGTSAAGLTASISRDIETKEFIFESGAVVLSDRGICCIDEFDKMDDKTRAVLHEVMQQQTVSFAKAGIVCTINARTALLASANPVKSKYDINKTVVENINMLPGLLNRFDLIYLMLDINNPTQDRKLADHICTMYSKKTTDTNSSNLIYDMKAENFLYNYISYARMICKPKITTECESFLIEFYLKLRGKDSNGSLFGSPGQLDSLIRISKALARMELNNKVQQKHVKEACRLIETATYQALTDPITGKIDFDQLHSGASEAARVRVSYLQNALMSVLDKHPLGLSITEIEIQLNLLLQKNEKQPLGNRELQRIIEHADTIGLIGHTSMQKYTSLQISS